ncbi:MAG: hypothetical protein BWY31_02688 [Lentisphaerae bacterium ADurb.Bin242]|nr:MAG: hypothetical protein BWY31_02688 [Lentisphaerae bacterium ADurb.Bin242]
MNLRKYCFFYKIFLILLGTACVFAAHLIAEEPLRCNTCKKLIPSDREYIVSQNKCYCSRECFVQSLPVCTICGKRSFTGGIYALDHSFFACPECMKKPRCFACQIPADGQKLPDGRVLCPGCTRTAVVDPVRAQSIFNEVRDEMRFSLGIGTNHPIFFSLATPEMLHKLSGTRSNFINEQGLFKYEAEVERVSTRDFLGRKTGETLYKKGETSRIYVLDYLPKLHMQYVIAHELAHDWMTAHYPGIRDPAVKEGFAEYIAWRYNNFHKRSSLNRRIETNPDPVYGEGFRRIRRIAERDGFEGLKRYLEFKSKQNQK